MMQNRQYTQEKTVSSVDKKFFVFTVLTDAMKHISAAMQPEAMIFIQMLFKFIHKVTVKMHNLATSDAFQM